MTKLFPLALPDDIRAAIDALPTGSRTAYIIAVIRADLALDTTPATLTDEIRATLAKLDALLNSAKVNNNE